MIKCPCCKELISLNSPSYKCSRGFVNKDGSFFEDSAIIVHLDCAPLIDICNTLEELVKDS